MGLDHRMMVWVDGMGLDHGMDWSKKLLFVPILGYISQKQILLIFSLDQLCTPN